MPSDEGFCLCHPVGAYQQPGQIVQANGHLGMIGTEAGLINEEGAPHGGLCLFRAVGGLQQLRQITQTEGHLGMIGTKAGLIDAEGTPHHGLGLHYPFCR